MAYHSGNLFALTSPSGQIGIFHQLGSTVPGRICVQNCLVEKFGSKQVFIGKGLYNAPSGHLQIQPYSNGVGYLETPDGMYSVERITPVDSRYNSSNVIREYSDFFGRKVVKEVQLDTPKSVIKKQTKELKKHQVAAFDLVQQLIELFGYVKAPTTPDIVPFRRAAKKKK